MEQNNNMLVRQNVNFLEFPLWSVNELDNRCVFNIKTKNGVYTYRANQDVGIPDATDMNFLFYLLLLAQKNNSDTVYTTTYEACKNTGYTINKGIYNRFKKSLKKWKSVSIDFDGNYYCPIDNKIYSSMGFQVLSYKIEEREVKKRHKQVIKIKFNEDFLESSRQIGLFNLIDFKLYIQLKTPLSKRIYEYLPKHLNGNKIYKISDTLLFPKLRLVKKRYRSDIVRQFNSIQKAIDKYNSAQSKCRIIFWYEQKSNTKTEFICSFQNKKPIQISNKVTPTELSKPKQTQTKSTEIRKKLGDYGFKDVSKIFKQHSLEILEKVLIDFKFIASNREKNNNPIPNKGGYIRSLLPEAGKDYEFSSEYKQHLTELKAKENQKQKDAEERRKNEEEEEKHRKDGVLSQKAEAFFLNLPQEEQDAIKQEAINQGKNSFFKSEIGIKFFIRKTMIERYGVKLEDEDLKPENIEKLQRRFEKQETPKQTIKTPIQLTQDQLRQLTKDAITQAEKEVSNIINKDHQGFKKAVESRVRTLIKQFAKEKYGVDIEQSNYQSIGEILSKQ